jgi:hypothetical protein
MNLQELNSTGQPIWGFLVTSASILSGALTIWGMFYQWSKFYQAPVIPYLLRFSGKAEMRCEGIWWTRFKSFLWLVSHGHVLWCWRSGILFALLTKGKKGFTLTCDGKECWSRKEISIPGAENTHPLSFSTHNQHAPVDYILAHSEHESMAAFSFAAARSAAY